MFRKRAGRCCPLVSAPTISRWRRRRSKLGHGKQKNISPACKPCKQARLAAAWSFYLKRRRRRWGRHCSRGRGVVEAFRLDKEEHHRCANATLSCQPVTVIVRIKLTTRLSLSLSLSLWKCYTLIIIRLARGKLFFAIFFGGMNGFF